MLNKNMRILGSGLLLSLASVAGNSMAGTFTMSLEALQAGTGSVAIFNNAAVQSWGTDAGKCNRMRRTWDYNGGTDKFKTVETVSNSNTALTNKCPITEKQYVWANDKLLLVRAITRTFAADGTALPVQTVVYNPGILVYMATMNSGEPYQNMVKLTSSSQGSPNVFANTFIAATSYAGNSEPVTVGTGTYTDCFTVETNLNGSPSRTMRCAGAGAVLITNASQNWVRTR